METQAERNARLEARSRAHDFLGRAVDAALEAARSLAERSHLPLDGDSDSLALLSGCDLEDELDRDSADALAAVLGWLDSARSELAR